jgi:hypothetical protein
MGPIDQLRAGMPMDEVRQLLRGWRESLPSAFLSPDKTHLFYTIEFAAPSNGGRPIRLTFDNGKLLIWGEASDLPPSQGPAVAG